MFALELFQTWVASSKCGSNATRLLLDTSVANTHAEVKRKMVADFSCMFSFVKKCFTSNFLQKRSKRHALGHPPVVGGSTFISGDWCLEVWMGFACCKIFKWRMAVRRSGDIKAQRLHAAAVQPTSGLFWDKHFVCTQAWISHHRFQQEEANKETSLFFPPFR